MRPLSRRLVRHAFRSGALASLAAVLAAVPVQNADASGTDASPGVGVAATAPTTTAHAALAASAFAGASGIVRVNIAAGAGNGQTNSVSIGAAGLATESALAGAVAAPSLHSPSAPAVARNVSVSQGALAGAHGIVQVNLTAGDGNTTSNAFALHVHP